MKLTKRILSFIMAALMLFSCMAVTASADGATVNLVETQLDMNARTLTLKKLVSASGWDVSFSTDPSTTAAPTLLTETDEAFFYCNLVTGTKYIITVIAVVDSVPMTQTIELKLLNSQNAPSTPVPKKITTDSIEINVVAGCEYRCVEKGGDFSNETTFTGLEPGTYYTIEMRYKETSTHYASPVSTATIRTLSLPDDGVPSLPRIEEFLVDKTNNSITVKEMDGVEYSIDGGKNWQVSGHFTKLNPDTTYAIIARFRFDPSVQAPNPSCAPVEIRTNVRASYPADLKNCVLAASEGEKYANQAIAIAVTADTPADYHDTQFGDTKYVPQYYTIDDSPTKYYFTSSDGRVFKSSFVPGDAKANKKVSINVYFNKMKCVGEKADGDASWIVDGKEESKTYYVQVGESYTVFTRIRDFFGKVFNIFFNVIPGAIAGLIKGVDMDKIMGGLGNLTEILGALSGNGGTGGTGGTDGLGDILGGLTQ